MQHFVDLRPHHKSIVQYVAWAPLTAFTATLVTVWWLTRSRFAQFALDRPGERSLHQVPVPRTGGIGIHTGVILAAVMVMPNLPTALWLGFAILFLVSLLDDLRGVPVVGRLAAHLSVAFILATSVLLPDFGFVVSLIAALAIAWMANLYNFMDGSDGLAGGMTLFGFACYGVAAWSSGNASFALVNFSVAAASAAFLVFNFHPARVFMGDVGSVPLGFLAAALGITGWAHDRWPWWFPVLVFSPFIVDASATLLRRLLRRERVWEAHRDHYYQRLVQMGWGHRRTAFAEYILMSACGLLALLAMRLPLLYQATALAAVAVGYGILISWIERAWREFVSSK